MTISGSSGAQGGYAYTANLNFYIIALSTRKTLVSANRSTITSGVTYVPSLSSDSAYIWAGSTGTSKVVLGAYSPGTYNLGHD